MKINYLLKKLLMMMKIIKLNYFYIHIYFDYLMVTLFNICNIFNNIYIDIFIKIFL